MSKIFLLPIIGLSVVVVGGWAFFSIFDQQLTRKWGFATEIHLPAGHKFLNYDWYEDNIWTASRSDKEPGRITIQEHSRYGVLEGKIVVIETPQ